MKMKSLIESVNSFVELEHRAELIHFDQLYCEVVSEIDKLCQQIAICEKNGYQREQILNILSPVRAIFQKSPLGWRMQNWPRGYPGDYETIEYICDAINGSPENTVEYCCEEYALNCPATEQYRNLVQYQALEILQTFRRVPENPRLLSIACGGCRDLWSIQALLKEFPGGEIVLVDLDAEALEFSRSRLKSLERKLQIIPGNIVQSIYKLESSERFDIVVSGALFDHLLKPIVKYLIKHICKYLLKPNGKFIFTNSIKGNSHRIFTEYFGNLILLERDKGEILDICHELGLNQVAIKFKTEENNLRLMVEMSV